MRCGSSSVTLASIRLSMSQLGAASQPTSVTSSPAYQPERFKALVLSVPIAPMPSNFSVIEKDLRVTDNGDGTFTLVVLVTGNSTVYGMDGKAIARNPGQVRDEILIDNNGTPQDPSDDEFLEFIQEIKGSTGRTDDFCAAAVPALV